MELVVLATNNPGKLGEFRALLADLPVRLVTPAEIGVDLQVIEEGVTYGENAARKALAYTQATKLVSLGDDSGLEVAALGGGPGLRSARFDPRPGATDASRRRRLLEQLAGTPRPWLARFHCVIALATPAGGLYFAEGSCSGEVIPEERGRKGFGYDSIFLLPHLGRTMAELDPAEKNRLSHRAAAVEAARPFLHALLAPDSGSGL